MKLIQIIAISAIVTGCLQVKNKKTDPVVSTEAPVVEQVVEKAPEIPPVSVKEKLVRVIEGTVQIDRDVLVSSDVIIFKSNAKIWAYNRIFEAVADEIIFEDGVEIFNFADHDLAPFATNGAKGGDFIFRAKKITGIIRGRLIGQRGGEGYHGQRFFIRQHREETVDVQCKAGLGATGGEGGSLFFIGFENEEFQNLVKLDRSLAGPLGKIAGEEGYDINKVQRSGSKSCNTPDLKGSDGYAGALCTEHLKKSDSRCQRYLNN